MPLNLELKTEVKSHTKLIAKLENMNAEFKGVLKQKDVYFKVKKGLLKLRVENNSYCLIKYLRDEKGKRWSNYELLWLKGNDPEKYLRSIFEVTAVVEKKRKLYLYNNTRVHLDEVKNLGKFLELETLLTSGKKEADKRFKEICELLELDLSKQIRSSYKVLISGR